jgi:hypothetical protein
VINPLEETTKFVPATPPYILKGNGVENENTTSSPCPKFVEPGSEDRSTKFTAPGVGVNIAGAACDCAKLCTLNSDKQSIHKNCVIFIFFMRFKNFWLIVN